MELRDKETEGHTVRVANLTLQVARALGLSKEKLVHIWRGALLHDMGKLGVPDQILHKPGPLTNKELKGEEIPLAARLFAVVDVWDAMRSQRPYHPERPEAEVHQYLVDQAGKQFDPQIVDLFLSMEMA